MYTQHSVEAAREKAELQRRVSELEESIEDMRDAHRRIERNAREQAQKSYRMKESQLDAQIRLLSKDTVVNALSV